MGRRHLFLSIPLVALVALPVACGDDDDADANDAGANGADAGTPPHEGGTDPEGGDSGSTFRVSGTATYDWVPANDDVKEGGVLLDYTRKASRPIRRATVVGLENGAAIAQTTTNDSGAFDLDVPEGHSVTLRIVAETVATKNTTDGIAPNNCAGASWDVKVVDNTKTNAQYTLDDTTPHAAAASGIAFHAPVEYQSKKYVTRTAAPFAILDTFVTEIELVCQGKADVELPPLLAMWSVDNVPTGNDVAKGEITITHYQRDKATGQSHLAILGKEDVDTDEYDDHVIAHEFGHYLEDRLFRSDTTGGSHAYGDVLDPRTAFAEGWGNALSAMTFNDPVYVDTSGVGQADGTTIPVDVEPVGDDRGIYSESSVQYLLWSLFDNRNPGHGSLDRIFDILANFQKTTPAFTSALTFAGYYNQVYGGAAESLKTLWATTLASPYDALCAGKCTGTGDTADVFDTDNDLGIVYAATRHYREESGAMFGADFWRQSRLLVDGKNAATAHDQTDFGGYTAGQFPGNKLGAQRQYRYVSTKAQPTTLGVGTLGASSCTLDVLDMQVFDAGERIAFDPAETGPTAGCPVVAFAAKANTTYTIAISGQIAEIPSYVVTVSHKPSAPFTVRAVLPKITEETDLALPIVVTPTHDVTEMRVDVRGLDGVTVEGRRTASRPAVVRLARGAAGWVVVDVSGMLHGRRVAGSYVIPLRTKTPAPTSTIGALVTDADGKRNIAMKPVVR